MRYPVREGNFSSYVYVGGLPTWYYGGRGDSKDSPLLSLPTALLEPRFRGAVRDLRYRDAVSGRLTVQDMVAYKVSQTASLHRVLPVTWDYILLTTCQELALRVGVAAGKYRLYLVTLDMTFHKPRVRNTDDACATQLARRKDYCAADATCRILTNFQPAKYMPLHSVH